MDAVYLLQPISIFLELITAVLGVIIAQNNKKTFGWLIALTFSIYVFYDLARFLEAEISGDILSIVFLIASASIMWATWLIYKDADYDKDV